MNRLESPSNPALQAAKQATHASYVISLQVAKKKVAHTMAEDLIKPAAIHMARLLCGEEVAKKFMSVPLSDNTVLDRIVDMSTDVKGQVVARMKESKKFSLQLDESTDVSKNAQLMVFSRYEGHEDIEEEFLFCAPFETVTTGAEIFGLVDNFLNQEGLSRSNCVSVCTDGAPAMLGARQGFVAHVKGINEKIEAVHCLLHRENLAARHLSADLATVMKDVISIVNFVKNSALNTRLFERMCIDFGSDHQHLFFF